MAICHGLTLLSKFSIIYFISWGKNHDNQSIRFHCDNHGVYTLYSVHVKQTMLRVKKQHHYL